MERKYHYEVAIYLRGETMDPAEVSKVLAVSPSRAQMSGDKTITSKGREVTATVGLWAVVAERETQDVDELVSEVTSKFGADVPTFLDIPGVDEAYLDVFLAVDADDDGGGTCEFRLSAATIAELERLALPARFTVGVVKP